MANIMTEVVQAADDIKATRDQLLDHENKLRGILSGPATGGTSTVDLGGDAGVQKTLARVMREAAGRVGLQYVFSSATDTTVSPGAGRVAFNAADPADVTEIVVSTLDSYGLTWAAYIATWHLSTTLLNRGSVLVQRPDGLAAASFHVVAASVIGAGFVRLRVAYDDHAGDFGGALDGEAVAVQWVRTGDSGSTAYTFNGFFPGDALPAGGEPLLANLFEVSVSYAVNLPGWRIVTRTPPDEDAVYKVVRRDDVNDEAGTQFGTLTILEGTKVGVIDAPSAFTCAPDSILEVRAPDPPVTGIRDLLITTTGLPVP